MGTLMFVNLMQIDLIRYELLTLSLRDILNSFSNCFPEFYSYEGFSSSDIGKNVAENGVNGGWQETLNLLHVSGCEMLHFVTSYMKRNKSRKPTFASV